MKILVTGANGFIGKNLCLGLKEKGYEVLPFDIDNDPEDLASYVKEADWIFHLAGVNRPLTEEEFTNGNVNLTKRLIDLVKESGSLAPLVYSSSTQAEKDNPYGRSKRKAEELLLDFGMDHPVYVYRFYNVYGKWCNPNYNSVIATFCFNIARGLPISVNPDAPKIDFVYIDDIVSEFLRLLQGTGKGSHNLLYVEPHDQVELREIVARLTYFKESRDNHMVPHIEDPFGKKLYSTYLSYLDENDFSYPLDMHKDYRGSFTEILKTEGLGQISVNVSKPGITKGNHYHHTKTEKYLVVSGTCEIKFRKIGTHDIITYVCSDKEMKVVDIPPGYTHSIKNIGKTDSVTIMWANELYDPDHPDTIYCPVEEDA